MYHVKDMCLTYLSLLLGLGSGDGDPVPAPSICGTMGRPVDLCSHCPHFYSEGLRADPLRQSTYYGPPRPTKSKEDKTTSSQHISSSCIRLIHYLSPPQSNGRKLKKYNPSTVNHYSTRHLLHPPTSLGIFSSLVWLTCL
jgi:hypothetical protein